MSIRVSNIRLAIDEPETALPGRLADALGLRADELERWRILRNSQSLSRQAMVEFDLEAMMLGALL